MNSIILTTLGVEPSKLMTFRVVNLYTPLKREPIGFVDIKDNIVKAHFGYYENPNCVKHLLV